MTLKPLLITIGYSILSLIVLFTHTKAWIIVYSITFIVIIGYLGFQLFKNKTIKI